MLYITNHIKILDSELEWKMIRAQGAGGQNVNKVSSAVQVRFDIHTSGLPAPVKESLLKLRDQRITKEGVIIIKAQRYRHQESNRADALMRLKNLILKALNVPKARRPTKPTKGASLRRLDQKNQRARLKKLRAKPDY